MAAKAVREAFLQLIVNFITVATTGSITPGHDRSIAENGSKSTDSGMNLNFA